MSDKIPIKSSKISVTRTCRLPKIWDEILEYEANKKNISISTLLNQIINDYIINERYLEKNPSIMISIKNLINFLNEMSDEQIIRVARKSGNLITMESFLIRGLETNHDNLLWFMRKVFDNKGRWFNINIHSDENNNLFHLSHNYTWKWSLYLKNYFEELYRKMFNGIIEIEITENSAFFQLPKKYFKITDI